MHNKNNMLSANEKEKIVKKYLSGESPTKLSKEYNFAKRQLYYWVEKYQNNGVDGLKSNTGKSSKHHKHMGLYLRKPKNREEELEIELMKKDVEIARLKKGYQVKGAGLKKEYVTTFDKNTK